MLARPTRRRFCVCDVITRQTPPGGPLGRLSGDELCRFGRPATPVTSPGYRIRTIRQWRGRLLQPSRATRLAVLPASRQLLRQPQSANAPSWLGFVLRMRPVAARGSAAHRSRFSWLLRLAKHGADNLAVGGSRAFVLRAATYALGCGGSVLSRGCFHPIPLLMS